MNDIVIQAENIGKRYRLGGGVRYKALRDSLADAAKAAINTLYRVSRSPFANSCQSVKSVDRDLDFWALKDVSFEVRRGEVVGIIGRNGAGKSTLLKILSRITEPTVGRISLRGRVGSLLEVGTGFHPELSGRENIYLNGAILGMKRAEIARKFDEIVAFSEVEKFLDTPVKHYSSGMYMRLAFSVAAHLEPEILLVDEVLAVGDAAFQKKCLGKMSEVAHQGRTVLFVSHNMAAVASLCSRVLWIENAMIRADDSPTPVISNYMASGISQNIDLAQRLDRTGSGTVRYTKLWLENLLGEKVDCAFGGQPLIFAVAYEACARTQLDLCRFSLSVHQQQGQPLFICSSEMTCHEAVSLPHKGVIRWRLPVLPMTEGQYLINLFIERAGEVCDQIENADLLHVPVGQILPNGSRSCPRGWEGLCTIVPHQWEISSAS